MKPLTAQQIADILGVPIVAGDAAAIASGGVSTDTRTLDAGALFFALRGENFNGDEFAQQALEGEAAVAVVQEWSGDVPEGKAVIAVADTLLALQQLAHWWRRQLDLKVVAITGSNGKTSTKDFLTAILSQKFKVTATRGNYNNHIGVPLSVLAASEEDEVAVWEMGMNHSGEIAPLCEIGRPKYGVITNIGTAHIEYLGTRDAIAEEKGMLARALPDDGIMFLPAICEYHGYFRDRTKASITSVGNGRGLVRAEEAVHESDHTVYNLVIEGQGTEQVNLPVAGKHMVNNSLLAAAVAWRLGMTTQEIAKGLSASKLTGGRMNRYQSKGVEVIDDTYNANPESMAAAIETLSDMPVINGSRRIIVLGKMGELGMHAASAHASIGKLAVERGLKLVAVGEGAEGIAEGADQAPHFKTFDEASAWLSGEVKSGDIVLFKGSRAATIEKVMNTVFPRN